MTQNPNLEVLFCGDNQLTSLDLTQTPNLEQIACANNQLSGLDVTQAHNLWYLDCGDNQLTSLDVTQAPDLQQLYCSNNQINSLNIANSTNFKRLTCTSNQLTSLNIKNGNNHDMYVMWADNNPNLTCINVDDETATYQTCDIFIVRGWCKDNWAEYSESCILATQDFSQVNFILYPNPALDILNVKSQGIIDSIRIYSLGGILIKDSLNNSISVSELPAGIYFVEINEGANSITKKFVKS